MHAHSHQCHIRRRMRRGMRAVLSLAAAATAALAWLAAPQPATAQSFDCTRARTPDEKAVCADPLLSVLDEIMTDFYRRLRDYAGRFDNAMGLQAQLVDEARAFLKTRARCGTDRDCLEQAYRARIRQLLAWWQQAMDGTDAGAGSHPSTSDAPDDARPDGEPAATPGADATCRTIGFERIPEMTRMCPDLETYAEHIETWPLTRGLVACALPCEAGAYNVRYRILVLDPANPENVRSVTFATVGPKGGKRRMEEIVNPAYDPASRTLHAFDRGRGLGDCGTKWTWRWTGGAFELEEQREKTKCDGRPGPWRRLWPRRQ